MSRIYLLAVSSLLTYLFSAVTAAQQPAPRTHSIGAKGEVKAAVRWEPSGVKYSNATELVVARKMTMRAAPDDKDVDAVVPEARILVTTEPRLNRADAVKRLRDIATSRDEAARFVTIAGWPAVEMSFVEEVPRRSKNPGPPAFSQRGLTAIAVDDKIVRFEISLTPDADRGLLAEAQTVARSATFPSKGNEREVARTLQDLDKTKRNSRAAPLPQSKTTPPQPLAEAGATAPAAATGTPVRVQGGLGELEVAASPNANNIVIASNASLSFSTNSGTNYAAGNAGVFGLNDPSMSRGQSGNFYLGVIAFPNGTAAQGNQTGCTNAVNRSTDNGANFVLQGFSALCPQNGAGVCFPDQEHIAADRINASANNDQLYAVWRNFTPAAAVASCRNITTGFPTSSITCSQDNGGNWTATAAMAGAGDFPRVAVGRDGSVYAVSIQGNNVLLNKFSSCANGLAAVAGFPVTVATLTGPVGCPMAGLDRCNNGNTLSSPVVSPDPADANHIMVSFAENDTAGGERVVVAESRDAGLTFPRRATVSGSISARRFMPWSCSARGDAWVGWYDRRAALAAGVTNDLTDYFIGPAVSVGGATPSLTAGTVRNLTNNPDPQCASGWPCVPRARADSDTCTVQPQLAGICLRPVPPGGGSQQRCDFNTIGACPAGENCVTGGGCPKYGDYNGIACADNHVIAAWASATAPQGLPAVAGLTVFSSTEFIGPTRVVDICRRNPEVCVAPIAFDRDLIRVKCKLLPCIVFDPVPKNCTMKWNCPGCDGFGLCPPFYHITFDDTIRPWEVSLIDREGNPVPQKLTKRGKLTTLSFRPAKEDFKEGSIGDYRLVLKADKGIKPGVEYKIRAKLDVSDRAAPK